VQLRNWENVQRLVDTVPEAIKIPVFRPQYLSDDPTLLHFAVSQQADPITLQGIIRVMDMEEVNRASEDDKGGNLLHWCANSRRDVDVIAAVLAASPQTAVQKDLDGLTPIDILLYHRPLVVVAPRTLIRTLITGCPDAINHIFDRGNTFLHYILQWWVGLIPGKVETVRLYSTLRDDEYPAIVRFLLDRKPELAHIANRSLVTPLHLACWTNNCSVVKDIMALLSPEQLMACDDQGRNALDHALHPCHVFYPGKYDNSDRSEFLNIVGELLGASYDLIYHRDKEGRTPLTQIDFVSTRIGLISFLRQAVFAFDPQRNQHKTRNGELFLHAAFYTKEFPLCHIEALVMKAPEQAKEANEAGNLPLHLAAQMKYIWDDKPRDVNRSYPHKKVKILSGQKAVDLEAYQRVIMSLLRAFPDAARTPNGDGLLPLHLMIRTGGRPWETRRHSWEGGIKWYLNEIQQLLEEHPAAICELDLRGDALATFLSRLRADILYRLLREAPHVIRC
jgi:ankyrin repeat protein